MSTISDAIGVYNLEVADSELAATAASAFAPYWGNTPYHNLTRHGIPVVAKELEYANLCEQNNQPVSHRVLIGNGLGHDTLAHVPLDADLYNSVEQRSGVVAVRVLSKLGYSPIEVEIVREDIEDTEVNLVPRHLSGVILNWADADNLGHDFITVLGNTARVFLEHVQLHGWPRNRADGERWLEGARLLLPRLIERLEPLGPFDTERCSTFKNQALNNLVDLGRLTLKDILSKYVDV